MRLIINNVAHDIVNYMIPTHKLYFGTGKRVVLIADLHGYHNNKKKKVALIEAIRVQKAHHIVIAGDHMDVATGKWANNVIYKNLCDLVLELSKIAPVILSQGNHDINGGEKIQKQANQRFLDLAKLNPGHIFPLINDKVTIDEFEIVGFTPSYETISNTKIQTHGIARDKYINEYEESGQYITGGDSVIVEIAGHNPYLVGVGESDIDLGKQKKVDNFLEGHIHNAYRTSMKTRENPDKYLTGGGYIERVVDYAHDGSVAEKSLVFGKVESLARGVTYIDDLSQQHYILLNNGHYYRNAALNEGKNIKRWILVDDIEAINDIISKKLHAVTVTGGVKKFSPIPRKDEPEITVIDYVGRK